MLRICEIVHTNQQSRWQQVLEQVHWYDFYHLPQYHALAEDQGEGTAYLLVYEEEQHVLALPLLVRSLAHIEGLQAGQAWNDATSVYGYVGPVMSHANFPTAVIQRFQAALCNTLHELRVVSVFSRLHPLIAQHEVITGLGICVPGSKTVSIDLSLPVDIQRSKYRQNHRRDINKLKRSGIFCILDAELQYLDQFIKLYYETMDRVSAVDNYFFERAYFDSLMQHLRSEMHLFVSLDGEEVICGGIFTLCNNIVQYHLGGTRNAYLRLAPMKLVFDDVRDWANKQAATVFHLGGGVGSQEDSLFQFKAGFSDQRHTFSTWRWVVLPDIYNKLCIAQAQWNEQQRLLDVTSTYFPQYRAPVAQRSSV